MLYRSCIGDLFVLWKAAPLILSSSAEAFRYRCEMKPVAAIGVRSLGSRRGAQLIEGRTFIQAKNFEKKF